MSCITKIFVWLRSTRCPTMVEPAKLASSVLPSLLSSHIQGCWLLRGPCSGTELRTKVTGKTLTMPGTWKAQISCYCCTVVLYLGRASSLPFCKTLQFNDLILSRPSIENSRFGAILEGKSEFFQSTPWTSSLGPNFQA